MPKTGFTTVTFKNIIYEHYYSKYLKYEEKLRLQGITTFSGYITYLLSQSIGEFT